MALAALPALVLATGCADPFIEATTILEDTSDIVGPYQVDVLAAGMRSSDSLEIRYTRPERPDGIATLVNVDDDGDGPGDLYQGSIPGQSAGNAIGYYIVLIRNDEIVDRDPAGDLETGPRFVFSVTP